MTRFLIVILIYWGIGTVSGQTNSLTKIEDYHSDQLINKIQKEHTNSQNYKKGQP